MTNLRKSVGWMKSASFFGTLGLGYSEFYYDKGLKEKESKKCSSLHSSELALFKATLTVNFPNSYGTFQSFWPINHSFVIVLLFQVRHCTGFFVFFPNGQISTCSRGQGGSLKRKSPEWKIFAESFVRTGHPSEIGNVDSATELKELWNDPFLWTFQGDSKFFWKLNFKAL